VKKYIVKSVYISVFILISTFIISCEEDFTDIGSNVISNTKFDTDVVTVDIEVENSAIEKLQSDNISRQLSQYLLGVFNRPEYEKLEASIVSQIAIPNNLSIVDNTYGADTTVVTKIDTVFLKLPYQVSLQSATATDYKVDSIFGDKTKAFNLNIYRSNTYINTFNPSDPTKVNTFFSDDTFEKIGPILNETANFQFIPNENDTILVFKRKLFNNSIAKEDSLKLFASANSFIPIPFARVPLDQDLIKSLFLDKYDSSEFSSQTAFNDYFRGIILEATGNDGAIISYNFDNSVTPLRPSIEIYYTNTVLESSTTTVLDTIYKNDSFPLTGFRINSYKMENKTYPVNNEIKIQGTAGSEAKIKLFDQNKINDLKSKNWLINDASLEFYINQSADTTAIPLRLYLYKNFENSTNPIFSQIKDAISEVNFGGIDGILERDSDGKAEKYTFKITDYISDILSGDINNSPTLMLKAYNVSDAPASASDSIFRNYSWNPKAVTLFNNSSINGSKKAVLKLSYSQKK
jgi:hypothetical protein